MTSCTDCAFGLIGTVINGCDCSGGNCDLADTKWRHEVVFSGIPQAWTLVFSENSFDSYWGTPSNYYQNHEVDGGSWECSGSTLTLSGGSNSATGTIEDGVMTISGKDYIQIN